MKTTSRLAFALALGLTTIIMPAQAGPAGEPRWIGCKTEKVGVFEDGKGWSKAMPPKGIIRTEAQLKAFYKALGKKLELNVDFTQELLCVRTHPTWDRNSRSFTARIDHKGDFKLAMKITKMHCSPPANGPYYTEISLVRVPSKGIKSYKGQKLD